MLVLIQDWGRRFWLAWDTNHTSLTSHKTPVSLNNTQVSLPFELGSWIFSSNASLASTLEVTIQLTCNCLAKPDQKIAEMSFCRELLKGNFGVIRQIVDVKCAFVQSFCFFLMNVAILAFYTRTQFTDLEKWFSKKSFHGFFFHKLSAEGIKFCPLLQRRTQQQILLIFSVERVKLY